MNIKYEQTINDDDDEHTSQRFHEHLSQDGHPITNLFFGA
jgi:hypothetical protein